MQIGALAGLSLAVLYVAWPGLMAVSAYVLYRTTQFYQRVHRQAVGRLVLLMVVGWVMMMASLAGVATLYLYQHLEAAPVVLPFFLVWAASMVLIVWIVHRWGSEAVNINLYYLELASIDRVKTQFINSVAHELNTPLTPVMLRLSLLANGSLGPLAGRQQAAVESVARNLERLSLVIDQVVLSTQVQAGTLKLSPGVIDLGEAVAVAVERIRPEADAKHQALTLEGAATAQVPGDRPRIDWVLQAILSNAVKFTGAGGRITVVLESTPRGASVEVRDTGIGIPPDKMPILFQPFRQAHDPMQVMEAGSGLGLYISRALVELHGGKLLVASGGPGQGAAFRMELPSG
ncbi:MAG: sensor histidine kinase [Thermoplasmatota archaeon]